MLPKTSVLALLVVAAFAAKADDSSALSSKDQDSASDQVTSILVQPGPNGPRHVILSEDHQIISNAEEGISSRRGGHYHYPSTSDDFQHTVPPPIRQVTYGPARPIAVTPRRPAAPAQPAQLYHHRFAQRAKTPHVKASKGDGKGLSEAIYKYSTYIKHDKSKEINGDVEHLFSGREHDKPDYSVVTTDREVYRYQPQSQGLSAYRNNHEDEETKFRESIGDLYSDNFEKENDFKSVKHSKPLPYSKLYFSKQNSLISSKVNDNNYYTANKGYESQYNSFDDYQGKPSGFDDTNGGKVAPLLARFYKQPLPIIQTHLPPDSTGLFIQYYQPNKFGFDSEEYASNNYYEQHPQEKSSLISNYHTSDSEWTPINAPDGAVPAKSYSIPAPDLSQRKSSTAKVWRNDDHGSVVIGRNKQSVISNQQIQSNSEGVVSAVVRVKQ